MSEMKDKNIKKALECCGKNVLYENCGDCPYEKDFGKNHICTIKVAKDSLDLINRQQAENKEQCKVIDCLSIENAFLKEKVLGAFKTTATATAIAAECEQHRMTAEYIDRLKAEIKRLQHENLTLSQKRVTFPERLRLVNNTRIKTIEEAQEKLLKKLFPYDHPDKKNYSINAYAVYVAIINTMKEMAGEQQ